MYDSFYNLVEKPFQISTDTKFLWRGEKHQEALANLQYGLLDNNGFVVLTGDIGTGKTTLVNALLETLDDRVIIAKINHPSLEIVEFLNLLAKTFDPKVTATDKSELLIFFNTFLHQVHAEGKIVLLIIDEAHRLSVELLEEIRLLSNIEQAGKRLLNIIFVGQNELKPILSLPQCRALRQRISLFYEIQPLTSDETLNYIEHRLNVSGSQGMLFTRAAIKKIHGYTKGNPRTINILCDRALLTGFVKERKEIDADIILECCREMNLGGTDTVEIQSGHSQTALKMLRSFPKRALEAVKTPYSQFGKGDESAIVQRLIAAVRFMRKHRSKIFKSVMAAGIGFSFLSSTIGAYRTVDTKDAVSTGGRAFHRSSPPSSSTGMQRPAADASAGETLKEHSDPKPSPAGSQMDIPADTSEASQPASASPFPFHPARSANPEPTPLELAAASLKHKNYQKAVELLEAYRDAHPDRHFESSRLYSQALVGLAGERESSSAIDAENLLIKAIAASPYDTSAFMVLGKHYIHSKNYDRAIDAYQEALNLDPDSADAFFNLGFAYAAAGDFDASERAFARVVQKKPAYLVKALFNLAVVQQKLGKKMESIANLEAAAAIEPENKKVQSFLEDLKTSTTAGVSGQGK